MRLPFWMAAAIAIAGPAVSTPSLSADWPACGTVETFPGETWPAADATGWNQQTLAAARREFRALDSAAMMIVHRGRPVAAWGEIEDRYDLASLRKSVLSTLYGAVVADDGIDPDRTIGELGIGESDRPLSETERSATIRHLVAARSGILRSAHYEMGSWKERKAGLRQWALERYGQPEAPPGSVWLYNNWDFNVAAVALERATEDRLGPLFERQVAGPIDMQDFRPRDVTYVGNESYAERRMGNRSDHPAFMFTMSSRDLARLGILYLNCGRWQDRQILDRSWVLESITGRSVRDGAPAENTIRDYLGDYGYMWWVDKPGSRTFRQLETREPAYFGQGYRGHYLWVAPYLDLVVVHQVATTGGIGTWGQVRRRIFGSDAITDDDFQALLKSVIAAHPASEGALLDR